MCIFKFLKLNIFFIPFSEKYFEKKRVNETSSTFMKFPNDVRQAEKLNGGNPNIVDDEQFQPKKPTPAQSKYFTGFQYYLVPLIISIFLSKRYKDIFVDPKSKDVKAKSPVKPGTTGSPRRPGRPPKQKPTPPASSPTKVIHPRFQGQSDHEVRIRRQESTPPSSSSSSVTSPMSSPTSGTYTCDTCNFQTGRLNLMILHKKSHLGTLESAVSASASAAAKVGQKRLSSPVKKTVVPNKKSKKATTDEAAGGGNGGGDLFDQVKRNLDPKEEIAVKQTPKKPRQSTAKATKASPQPSTPKTPRTPKSTTPKSASSKASSVPAKSSEKAQLNPKKKWLKSSLQKDDNPEVKMKLMADWEEDEEEQQLRKEAALKKEAAEAAAVAAAEVTKEKLPESDSDQDLPANSGLLQQRSDDEDDGDYQMETDSPAKSPEKAVTTPVEAAPTVLQSPPTETEASPAPEAPSTTSPSTPKANETLVESESTNNASDGEPLAGLSAEIDKLNAEMDQMAQSNRMVESSSAPPPPTQSMSVNGDRTSHVNGIGPLPSANSSVAISNGIDSKRDEEIKQDVASLLAETSVPVLPDLSSLNKAHVVPPPPPSAVALKQDQEESVVVQEQQQHVEQLEIGTGNGNILVEGEDGETYMVVWEQGDSNMQELLVQGDDEGSGTRTLLIDPSSLQGSGTDFEKLFQMAVHAAEANSSTNAATIAAAAPIATTSTVVAPTDPQSNEQSNAT